MARQVLQTQDITYANRPANDAIIYLTYDRADMAFANYGPFWRQMRKLCIMKLFSRKRAESWVPVREEVGSTIETVMKEVGSPVNIGELVFALTRNITYRAAFGSFSHEGQDEFVKILQEFSKLFGAFNISDFFPWLGRWTHKQEFRKRLVKARGSLDGEDVSKGDFDESSQSAIKLTKANIKALIMINLEYSLLMNQYNNE
ncbi:Cytochrome P450 [Corchorus olitorius]|uniref:Cytochrome P450 n=1 Tax=Corchorus olitorius TaxID=93759 RepID=A0A1R3HYU9_9ROSI|nr:Cytochrome P450 [Corchorus olitorius]